MEDKKQDDEKDKKVPKIRFKGFTGEWEQKRLGEIAEIIGGGTPSTNNPEYWNGDINWYTPAEINEQNYVESSERKITRLGLEKSSAKILPVDTILFTSRAGIGKTAILKNPGATNQGFQSIVLNNDNNTYFVYSMTDIIKEKAEKVASGSTFAEISGKMLSNLEFMFTSKEEQKKIGEFFYNLDNLITLYQRKSDELKEVKKYMLQKMFPKNGETKPEIRFAGFTDDWEQCKLGEILEIVNNMNGDSYTKEDVLSVSDEFGCINQIRFQGRSFAGEDISNYKIVETGDIVYTRSPLKSKPYGIIKVVGTETGIVSPLYIVNKAKSGNDSEFIYRVFDSPEKTNRYLSPLVRKGAKNTMNISNDEWLSGEITVAPSFDEQCKIGQYFKALDNLITLNQRKCDELKELKKYMLQNMFPRMS